MVLEPLYFMPYKFNCCFSENNMQVGQHETKEFEVRQQPSDKDTQIVFYDVETTGLGIIQRSFDTVKLIIFMEV